MLYRGLTVVALAGVCFCLTGCPSSSGDGDGVSLQQRYADALANISGKLTLMGDSAGAEARFNESVQVAEQISDQTTKAHVLADLGFTMLQAGDRARAQTLLDKASAAAEQIQDPGLKREAEATIAGYLNEL